MKKLTDTFIKALSVIALIPTIISCDPPTEENKKNLSEFLIAGTYLIEKVQVEEQIIWQDTGQVMVFDFETKRSWTAPLNNMTEKDDEAIWEYNVDENILVLTYIDEEANPDLWQDSHYEIVDLTNNTLIMKDKYVMEGNQPWVWYLRRLTDADYAGLLKSITFTNLNFFPLGEGKYEANPRTDLPFTVEYVYDPVDYKPLGTPYWSSSNESVAVVSQEGVVSLPTKPVSGETEISVTCDGVTASFTLKLMHIN